MRGRTLNDAFIILDESQNTTAEQMKMFLTRIGFGSTVVVTGDMTQIDLPSKTQSWVAACHQGVGCRRGYLVYALWRERRGSPPLGTADR